MGTSDADLLLEIERDLLDDKPLAGILRKVIILGGRLGSEELRDWVKKELDGYSGGEPEDVPAYRTVSAPVMMDAILGPNNVSQRLHPSTVPAQVAKYVSEETPIPQGVGELEAQVEAYKGKSLKVYLPGEELIAHVIDENSGQPFQKITRIYWNMNAATLVGVLDSIRTNLAGFVAELRAVTPDGQQPTREAAANAVHVAVNGRRNKVYVNAAQSSGSGAAGADQTAPSAVAAAPVPWWKRLSTSAWALIVGAAGIVSAVLAWLTFVR